jgi:hypothetical protein
MDDNEKRPEASVYQRFWPSPDVAGLKNGGLRATDDT